MVGHRENGAANEAQAASSLLSGREIMPRLTAMAVTLHFAAALNRFFTITQSMVVHIAAGNRSALAGTNARVHGAVRTF